MATESAVPGLLVGHLIARIERARAGLILMDKLCIRGQDATDPLKSADYQDYQELSDFVCETLKEPFASATGPQALAEEAPQPDSLARQPIITGRFC